MHAIVRPAAAADIEDAVSWYEQQRPGLGVEFLEAVDHVLRAIVDNPRLAPVVQRNTRRRLLSRFPYGIYYRVYPDIVVVVACMHGRRDPRRWRSRR